MRKLPDYYQIISSYIGNVAKPEPWDEYALQDDLVFWENHALIFGEENILVDSKTDICPWILNQPAISKIKT